LPSRIAHWTPRYIYNRIRWGIYQRRNPDKPWLAPRAIELLSTMLVPSDVGLEWGSGRSTCWFAGRMKHLTSIEDNPQWHQRVSRMIAERGLSNVTYRLLPPPGESPAESQYVHACDEFSDETLGFALVDGSSREHCALNVIPKIAPGGLLVIDNINWFLDHPTHSPASRAGKGPLNAAWAEVTHKLAPWRMIWATSGVTDTAIWIRPAGV